jgi:hypothetical protein
MKKFAMVLCWSVSAGTIVYAAANPACGVAWQSPWSALTLGVIGLGLIRHARHSRPPVAADAEGPA